VPLPFLGQARQRAKEAIMTKKPPLSPKNDAVFKTIFGDPNNSDILTNFLQSIIDLPPEEYDCLTIVDPNLRHEAVNDKSPVLDIKLKTKSGKAIDIEIQLCNSSCLKERIVYYTSKMITEQISAGDDYKKIKSAITILITDFKLIKYPAVSSGVFCSPDVVALRSLIPF
jgi:predicted transposase/invertase (TIGR01784 family)